MEEFIYYEPPKHKQENRSRKKIKCKLVPNNYTDEGDCHVIISHGFDEDGYGHIRVDGKTAKIHRYVYEKHIKKIDVGKVLRHKCNNPSCCNPMHLIEGTPNDNSKDMIESGRSLDQKGSLNHCAVLSERDVYEIKHLYKYNAMKQKDMAKVYGVSPKTINNITSGKQWKHVTI